MELLRRLDEKNAAAASLDSLVEQVLLKLAERAEAAERGTLEQQSGGDNSFQLVQTTRDAFLKPLQTLAHIAAGPAAGAGGTFGRGPRLDPGGARTGLRVARHLADDQPPHLPDGAARRHVQRRDRRAPGPDAQRRAEIAGPRPGAVQRLHRAARQGDEAVCRPGVGTLADSIDRIVDGADHRPMRRRAGLGPRQQFAQTGLLAFDQAAQQLSVCRAAQPCRPSPRARRVRSRRNWRAASWDRCWGPRRAVEFCIPSSEQTESGAVTSGSTLFVTWGIALPPFMPMILGDVFPDPGRCLSRCINNISQL